METQDGLLVRGLLYTYIATKKIIMTANSLCNFKPQIKMYVYMFALISQ
jgi:hypothetical protein